MDSRIAGQALRTERAWRCTSSPLRAVEPSDGDQWEATDGDPQFHVEIGESRGPGFYRFSALLDVPPGAEPSIYLDLGSGWSEASCWKFAHDALVGRWTFSAWLPGLHGAARFDPMQLPGRFVFRGLLVERFGDGEAMLGLLAAREADSGMAAQELIRAAAALTATSGIGACLDWLATGASSAATRIDADTYATWIQAFDTPPKDEATRIGAAVDRLPARPLVLLLMPVEHDADEGRLAATLSDIVAQGYVDWQLIAFVAGVATSDTRRALDRFVASCSRITAVESPAPEAVTGSMLDAVRRRKPQLVSMIDGCPRLRAHALFALVDAWLGNRPLGIVGIHGDHDRIDGHGRREDAYFTPQWNPDLFCSQHYLGPLVLFAGSLAGKALECGLLSPGCGAAEEFAIRCIALAGFEGIGRVPLILSHRTRNDRPGTPQRRLIDERRAAALRAVPRDGGMGMSVDVVDQGCHVHWPLPPVPPLVSLVVPTRDGVRLLSQCVSGILEKSTYPAYELVIVDNQSKDPETLSYLESIQRDARVRVLRYDAPFNYSALNNFAVAQTEGEIVGLVNDDIEVISPDWLEQMVQHAIRPGIGAVGAMLYYPDDLIQHAGVTLGLGGVAGHPYSRFPRKTAGPDGRARLVQGMSAVTAACLLVKRTAFDEVGGLDECLTVAFNDVDFCIRLLKAGYRNLWTPLAEMYHHESASRGSEDTPEKFARFKSEVERMMARWPELLHEDPAYSPNLSYRHGDSFKPAFPPRFAAGIADGDYVVLAKPDKGETGAPSATSRSAP